MSSGDYCKGEHHMADYTEMSAYYDLIMESGYYNYEAIVQDLDALVGGGEVLELGVGTGLILHRLAACRPDLTLAGIDFTQAMLDIAAKRLAATPEIVLSQQNVVTMAMDVIYNTAFSYGGVWYFVRDEELGTTSMISHLQSKRDNELGLKRVAAHLSGGGSLFLGIQTPHHNYSEPVFNGMVYEQQITPIKNGFRKVYSLRERDVQLMEQSTDYRVFSWDEARHLLDLAGFDHKPRASAGLFEVFCKR
jgi:SAM-dependent methyltransferase